MEALKRKTKEVEENDKEKTKKKGKIDHDFNEEGVTCFIERSKRKERNSTSTSTSTSFPFTPSPTQCTTCMPVEATQSWHPMMEIGHERPGLVGRLYCQWCQWMGRLMCMPVQGLLQ